MVTVPCVHTHTYIYIYIYFFFFSFKPDILFIVGCNLISIPYNYYEGQSYIPFKYLIKLSKQDSNLTSLR